MSAERSLKSVPRLLLPVLLAAFAFQLAFRAQSPPPQARAKALEPPPPLAALQLVSLGEPIALGKLLMLWLQAFDNQPGISIPFRDLDYPRVIEWLSRIVALDPTSQYPLLFASRLYAEVPVPVKQRQMLEFVYQSFLDAPNTRWRWLAHAVILARHRLHDMPLAMKYAQALRRHATAEDVPHWAQQMEIFVLEDMNELQSAKVLLGGLLDSGQITDPHELNFLTARLAELETRTAPAQAAPAPRRGRRR